VFEATGYCGLSSTKSDYVGLFFARKEAIWLRRMVNNLGIADDREKPVTILADNQGSTKLAKNSITSKRTKHIDIQYHFYQICG
jgi:hypothetical protein